MSTETPPAEAGRSPVPGLPIAYGREPGPSDGQLIHVLASQALSAGRRAAVMALPEPHRYALVTDDRVEVRDLPPSPRNQRLGTIAELPAYLADALRRGFVPSVWVAADAVRVVLDDDAGDRREERCRADLRPTPEWALLTMWSVDAFEGASRDLCKTLRTVLADAVPERGGSRFRRSPPCGAAATCRPGR